MQRFCTSAPSVCQIPPVLTGLSLDSSIAGETERPRRRHIVQETARLLTLDEGLTG